MTLRLAHRTLALDGPPVMMGIVNVTPDSFYDRGLTADPGAAVARGLDLVAAGAGMVDVGGMTARPGRVLSEEEETARVEPVDPRAARCARRPDLGGHVPGRRRRCLPCAPAPTS